MNIFVIVQSCTNTDGGNANAISGYPTKEKAIADLTNAILSESSCDSVEEWNETFSTEFNDCFVNNERDHWVYDNDDVLLEYYIQSIEVKD